MHTNYQQLETHYTEKPNGYYGWSREEMLAFLVPGTKTVLDIGCGEGGFGNAIKKAFPEIEVWGIEPNAVAAAKASEALDHVINASFEADMTGLAGKKFDCIVFNDVLEHLVNPGNAIQIAGKYLQGKNYIIASLPNILFFPVLRQILTQQDWKYIEHGILDNTHLRFFTRKSMIRLFEENGYDVKMIQGISRHSCGRLYNLLNTVFYKKLDDWKFMQFGLRAVLKNVHR